MLNIDKKDIERLQNELNLMREKYGLSPSDVLKFFERKDVLPISIFNSTLSPTETAVKFLRENKGLKFPAIAKLLNKGTTSCWISYRNARKKNPDELDFLPSKYDIPFSKLSSPNLSMLELISSYLKDTYDLSYHEIGKLLKRDERTIWTVCNRAKKKMDKKISKSTKTERKKAKPR